MHVKEPTISDVFQLLVVMQGDIATLKEDVTLLKDTVVRIHQRLTVIEGEVTINAYQHSRSAEALRGAGKLFAEV